MAVTVHPDLTRADGEESTRRARIQLRAQISRLERELSRAELDCARVAVRGSAGHGGGPRISSLGELERERDELVDAISKTTHASEQIETNRAATRDQLQAMIAEPAKFKFVRIRNSQMGLPSCKTYEATPRLGLVGMLAGWWQVKISSGCP